MRYLCFLLVSCFIISCSGDLLPKQNYVCPESQAWLPKPNLFSQDSGYLQNSSGKLFYWLLRAKNHPETAPIVLWLNGGPGSSSLIGLFYENGAYRLNPDLSIYESPDAWNENANILYVDQPIDVGFSLDLRSYLVPHDEHQIAKGMTEALLDFFINKHPEMRQIGEKSRPFYLFGESFAGTYIPWIARALLKHNAQKPAQAIALTGVGIGDGTVDVLQTWRTMPQYAWQNGLISKAEQNRLETGLLVDCEDKVKAELSTRGPSAWPTECWGILNEIKSRAVNINVYDIRHFGVYDMSLLGCYLNKPNIKQFLKVDTQTSWHQSEDATFKRLYSDDVHTTIWVLREVLSQGVRVLIYNGDQDLLVNYIGTEKWLQTFARGSDIYKPLARWLAKDLVDITRAGRLAGKTKSEGNLTYVRVHEAGHLVPMDQPAFAKDMFERFLSEKSMLAD